MELILTAFVWFLYNLQPIVMFSLLVTLILVLRWWTDT